MTANEGVVWNIYNTKGLIYFHMQNTKKILLAA